jgi:hypothetical protein
MYPLDTQMQKLVAQEHVKRLRQDARPAPKRFRLDRSERPTPRLRAATPNRASV